MSPEHWTTHYSCTRVPAQPLALKPPLRRAWKHKPRGVAIGTVWAGDGDAFVSIGKDASAKRLSLRSGKVLWQDTGGGVDFMTRWRSHLLVSCDGGVRELDIRTGEVKRARRGQLGRQDGFIVGDVLVGPLTESWGAIDLDTLGLVWERPSRNIPGAGTASLASDGMRCVTRDADGTAGIDVNTGVVYWQRPASDVGQGFYVPCIWQDRFYGFYSQGVDGALMALDLETGKIVWRWVVPGAVLGWYPYAGRAYCFFTAGRYRILDLASGEIICEKDLGLHVPVPVKGKKSGLMVSVRGQRLERWESTQVIVSETHAFLSNASGQIVVLKRDSGDVEQVVEIDGMPVGGPIIYENHLLIADFSPAAYCFEGA